jgi:DNA-binding transcriptional ArsR family regulator
MRIADYTSPRDTKVNLTVSYHSAVDLLLSLWILGERMAGEGLSDLDLGDDWFDGLAAGMSDTTRDDRRLRVLRNLADSDASLAEVAKDSDIAKSTLHHHLMLLRAAGLVGVQIGDTKRYSLRRDTISEAASSLEYYLDPENNGKAYPA